MNFEAVGTLISMMASSACGLVFVVAVIALIVVFGRLNYLITKAMNEVNKNPTEENVLEVYRLMTRPVRPGIRNHPDEWAKYRNMFYRINGSPKVTTQLKRDMKDMLVKRGLHIQHMKIIDNYKK